MSRISCYVMFGILVLSGAASTYAQEDKVGTMAGDQTQEKYKRKSITYLGITVSPGVNITEEQLALVAKGIRSGIELKRFDYNEIDMQKIGTIDDLVTQLKGYVKAAATDRAAAEAQYEARFKSARVYFNDIDRIMNSAYLYGINVTSFNLIPIVCPLDARQALVLRCTPGTASMKAMVNAKVAVYRANLTDDSKPPYTLLKDVTASPQTGSEMYEPIPPQLPASAGQAAQETYRAALVAYNLRLPQLQHDASLKAAAKASSSLSGSLAKELKKVPEFRLMTPVSGALSDGVEFMLGKNEGVALDETYEVNEFDTAGAKKMIGYVKVRSVGNATGTGEGTPSYAEKVKEKRNFVGGELLLEHPMLGMSVGVNAVFELAFENLIPRAKKELGAYPGAGFYFDKDISNLIKWTETYVSFEGDFLFLFSDYFAKQNWYLLHGMLGFKKKWYINSFVLTAGLRGGISYYVTSDYGGDNLLLGGGGDVVLGAEYYIKPEISIFLKVAGRIFTDPVKNATNLEAGINTALGLMIAF